MSVTPNSEVSLVFIIEGGWGVRVPEFLFCPQLGLANVSLTWMMSRGLIRLWPDLIECGLRQQPAASRPAYLGKSDLVGWLANDEL